MTAKETLLKHNQFTAHFLHGWLDLSCGAMLTDFKTVQGWGRKLGPYIQRQQGFQGLNTQIHQEITNRAWGLCPGGQSWQHFTIETPLLFKNELQGTVGMKGWWLISIHEEALLTRLTKTCQNILCTKEKANLWPWLTPTPGVHLPNSIQIHPSTRIRNLQQTNMAGFWTILWFAYLKVKTLRADLREMYKTMGTLCCSLPTKQNHLHSHYLVRDQEILSFIFSCLIMY